MISRMKMFVLFIALLFNVTALPIHAIAQDKNLEPDHTKIVLLADHTQVTSGTTFNLLFKIDIDDHWHIYWTNPGDSGEAMRVNYKTNDGVIIGEPMWPTPKKLPFGPLVNFGYEVQTLITMPVTIDENFKDQNINIKADIEILVCEEICIPEFKTLELSIPVSDANIKAHQDLFAKAQSHMPRATDVIASYLKNGDAFVFVLPKIKGFTPAHLFPEEWGIIDNTDNVLLTETDGFHVLTLNAETRDISKFDSLDFIVSDKNQKGHSVIAKPDFIVLDTIKTASALQASASWSILLLFALIGGLILNLMPCVFPILSLKALSLLKMNAKKDRKHAKQSALFYTGGIVASFSILAFILIALKASGAEVGWGFQLQSPIVITFLAWLMLVIGFNLLGFFELKTLGGSLASKMGNGNSALGSFATGILAVLLATPCTAPFMATAIGASLTQGAFMTWLIFAFLGLGLALPFLLISFIPTLANALPKPGAWMVTFKQFLAFPMFATFIWLVWVGAAQGGGMTLLNIMIGALVIAFVMWALPRLSSKFGKMLLWIILALTLAVPLLTNADDQNSDKFESIGYSQNVLDDAIASGQPVFVNMTAKWCVTCLVNEKVALSHPQTKAIFADEDVIYIKGDWTNRNDEITKYLARYGRAGVPLYVFYKDGNETVLPQILTPEIVKNTLIK